MNTEDSQAEPEKQQNQEITKAIVGLRPTHQPKLEPAISTPRNTNAVHNTSTKTSLR